MKNLFSLLYFLALTASVSAQTVKWGAEHPTEERNAASAILGVDDAGFYVLETDYRFGGKKHFFLEFYNHKLNQVKKEKLELKQGDGEKSIEGFYMSRAGTLWFLSSYNNKSQDKVYFFSQTVDKKLLKPKNDLKKLAEIPDANNTRIGLFTLADSYKYRDGGFSFVRSSDSSKILITGTFPNKKNDESSQFSLSVFSDEMSELWQKKVILPYKADLFDVYAFNVDNDGDVLILGKLYEKSRKEQKNKEANYKYLMLRFSKDKDKPDELVLNLDGKFVTDIKITSHDNGNYICSGMYSKKGGNADGCFFAEMDSETGETIKKSIKEFSPEFMTEGMSEKRKKKALERLKEDKGLKNFSAYDIKDLIRRDDGGCVLVAERFWIEIYQYYDMNSKTYRTRTIYHYEDILVINISPEGAIDWVTKIPKWQATTNSALLFFSYALAVVGDKIHIVYNDDEDNAKAFTGSDSFTGEKNSVTLLITIDAAGKIKRKELFNNKEEEIITVPKAAVQINDNQLILLGKKKKDQKFCRITF